MEENKKTSKAQKLTYEELENVANQLSIQLQKAKQHINQMSSVLTRLPYLFKVLENQDKGFKSDIIVKCIEEIEDILYPKEEEVEDEQA